MKHEIIVEIELAKKLNPLHQKTLEIEEKLANLEISPDGKIQGVKPITNRANGTLPPNSGHIKVENMNLIIAPVGKNTIFVVGQVK